MRPEDWADKKKVIAEVREEGTLLSKVTADLRNDYDVVYAAVVDNGLGLEFAGEKMKDNFDIVNEAVIENGLALEFASDALKENLEICKEAVYSNPLAMKFVKCKSIIEDREIIMHCVTKEGFTVRYASPKLKDDE